MYNVNVNTLSRLIDSLDETSKALLNCQIELMKEKSNNKV